MSVGFNLVTLPYVATRLKREKGRKKPRIQPRVALQVPTGRLLHVNLRWGASMRGRARSCVSHTRYTRFAASSRSTRRFMVP